jgi:hypothetical protein
MRSGRMGETARLYHEEFNPGPCLGAKGLAKECPRFFKSLDAAPGE